VVCIFLVNCVNVSTWVTLLVLIVLAADLVAHNIRVQASPTTALYAGLSMPSA
jgi:hypothetical protein